MGDSKLYTRVKVGDILTELRNYEKKTKSSVYRLTILKKIIVNMTLGDNEVILLFDQVIKLLNDLGNDPQAKRLCYLYLTTYWRHKPEEALKALDFIVNDYKRGSPEDMCLDLKTLCTIQLPEYMAKATPMLIQSLQSRSSELRKTAAYCVAQVFRVAPAKGELLKTLNGLLKDEDTQVVAAGLSSLNDITDKTDELTFTIDRAHSMHLAGALKSVPEWTQVSILKSLMAFVPQDHDTAAKLMDSVLPYLQSGNSAVVVNALKVIVYLCNFVPNVLDVFPSLPQMIGGAVSNLMLRPSDIQFLAMRNVILLLLDRPALLDLDIRMFFCQYDDPLYIKDTKLEIIFLLANKDNMPLVLQELQEYATDIDVQMVRKSIRAIGNLAVKMESTSEMCVPVLIDLLSTSIPYVVQEIVIVARDIMRKYPGKFEMLLRILAEKFELVTEPESKASLIWILGEYNTEIANAPQLLAQFTETFSDDPAESQLALLTAVMKTHLSQSGYQELAQNALNMAEQADDPDIRERAYFYWRILQASIPNAIEIVKPHLPELNTDTETLPQDVLDELGLNIGTLASIYLRPVSQVFRHCDDTTLPESPALVHQDLKTPRKSVRSRMNSLTL